MRIVLIGPTYPFRGGIAHYNSCLNEQLRENHETLLISLSKQYPKLLFPGQTQQDLSENFLSTPTEPLLNPIHPSSWYQVCTRISQFKPEAVVFQWWTPYFSPCFSSIMKRLSKEPNLNRILLCHNIFPHEIPRVPGAYWLVRRMIKKVFRQADGFLVHSEKMSSQVSSYNRDAEVRRIFHPVYDFFQKMEKKQQHPKNQNKGNRIRLLFFGKIRAYKGLEVFLRALVLLKERGVHYRATVAGEFYIDDKPFKDMVEHQNISDQVVWHDHYIPNEKVSSLFRETDLVVLPYLDATQSGVVPLAFGFCKPVVVSDVGSLGEVVEDGKTGYLVPPGDASALADSITFFSQNPNASLLEKNIRQIRSDFSWSQVEAGLLALLGAIGKRQSEKRNNKVIH